MINFPFGTNGKLIILGVPILKHITVCGIVGIEPGTSAVERLRYAARLSSYYNGQGSFSGEI